MKKIRSFFIYFGICVCSVALLAIAYVLYQLPSLYEVHSMFYGKTEAVSEQSQAEHRQELPVENTSKVATEKPKIEAAPEGSQEFKDRQKQLSFTIDALTKEGQPLSEVCPSLIKADHFSMEILDPKDFGKRFEQSMNGKTSDPLMESIKPAFRHIFGQSSMKELFKEIESARSEVEASSIISKVGFYKKLYDVYTEMKENQQALEQIMDKSYLLLMFARAVEKKPDLKSDANVVAYCMDLENLLNESQDVDYQKTKEQFTDFLEQNSIDPKDIGFEPKYKTHLQFSYSKSNMQFSGWWFEQILSKNKPQHSEPKTEL